MSNPRQRMCRGRFRTIRIASFVCILLALGLRATTARSQGTAYTGGASGEGVTETKPVKVAVRVGDQRKVITFVARNDDGILFTDSDTGVGTRFLLKPDTIEDIEFALNYEPTDVMTAVDKRNWSKAIRLLQAAIEPTLPYLDLPENNAAEPALELGGYMMRAAEQRQRLAGSETEAAQAVLEKIYVAAYRVFTQAARADWSPVGKIASLKRIKCLLELKKPKTAVQLFQDVEEPFVGDAAYGLYWLMKAQLDLAKGDTNAAMDAAVKSLSFENKDIDTFPDALFISATCYEEMENWHRARDVYYELARLFPHTDWQATALRRLSFIRGKGLTDEEETMPIENVFFGLKEDVNGLVDDLLKKEEESRKRVAVPEEPETEEIDLETAE